MYVTPVREMFTPDARRVVVFERLEGFTWH
jgi:hypothetical protein